MVKVSVIIPVYNVEQYLRQSLDSILGQTLEDIEIILVNDGSEGEEYQKIFRFPTYCLIRTKYGSRL